MAFYIISVILLACIFHRLGSSHPTSFKWVKPGKFPDLNNTRRYHQCLFLYGKLRYLYNKCPATDKVKTCFSERDGYCLPQACDDYVPPKYQCAGRKFECVSEGVFAHPDDTSIYYKCFKHFKHLNEWEVTCYTFSKKHKTCFSESDQKCLSSKESCKTPKDTVFDNKTSSLLYQCDYHEFTCSELGPGPHPIPCDRSVYFECVPNKKGKLYGKCKVCPGKMFYSERHEKCMSDSLWRKPNS